ncbi:MAG: wax ester/triacylglycerol synthase family O-acyltransferase [Ilumatobacteraceae bacterium]
MHQLSVIDTTFLATETQRTPNHLCMLGIYDPSGASGGAPSFEQIMAKLESCLALVPSLRHKLLRVPLDLDRPYWVDDHDFDLEFHVRQLALPRPGDWRQLRTQVARLHSRPLDLTRPPWEITVIDGLDSVLEYPEGCFATALKVHHAAIDGQSGVELLNVLHDLTADLPPPDGLVEPWTPEPLPSGSDLLRRAGVHAIENPLQAVRAVAANVTPLAREAVTAGRRRSPGPKVVRTRFNHPVSAHRTWEETRCSLADMKRVKNQVAGASINDACLSVVAGAMTSYLTALGEPPTESLVTTVPVSTRTPDQVASGGNQISGMLVSFHSDIDDPLDRLAAIAAETATKKAAQSGVAIPVLLEVAEVLPGALIGAAVRGASLLGSRAPVAANTVVTNVPGSPVPLYFLGCELVRSTGCVPLVDGVGLFHCVTSFCGVFTFMFTADRDLMPDPEVYRGHLEASIAEHLAAAAESEKLAVSQQAATRAGMRSTAKQSTAKKQTAREPTDFR